MQKSIDDILYSYYSSSPNANFWASSIDEWIFRWIYNDKKYESIYFSIPKAIHSFSSTRMLDKAKKDIKDSKNKK